MDCFFLHECIAALKEGGDAGGVGLEPILVFALIAGLQVRWGAVTLS